MVKYCSDCDGTGVIECLDKHGFYESLCDRCFESLGEIDDDGDYVEFYQKSYGLTFEARQKGGLAKAENYDGWPKKTSNYGEALKNSGRRFDEEKMLYRGHR